MPAMPHTSSVALDQRTSSGGRRAVWHEHEVGAQGEWHASAQSVHEDVGGLAQPVAARNPAGCLLELGLRRREEPDVGLRGAQADAAVFDFKSHGWVEEELDQML